MTSAKQPSYRTHLAYQAALLGGVCFLVSMLLILGNAKTSNLIEEKLTQDKLAMMEDVMPAKLYDNNPVTENQTLTHTDFFSDPVSIMPTKKNNQLNGAVLQLFVQGWGGKIQFIMGVDANGEIIGVRIVSHKETPGLGDKIELTKSPWITYFNGKSLLNTLEKNWAVKKDGGEFDQFAGATITPRAVVKGVHQGMLFYQQWLHQQDLQQHAEINTEKKP